MAHTSRQYEVDGIHVQHTVAGTPNGGPPLLFVHGGLHAAWCWDRYVDFLARHGWTSHVLDWRGHGQSARLAPEEALRRGIEDVAEDIETVAVTLGAPPVVVAHSMGALATMKFAERNHHSGLVLLTPALPAEVSPEPIELPCDPEQMWGPPPFELSRQLFMAGASDDEARRFFELLVAESPKAVAQVTGEVRVSIDPVRISGPMLVVSAEADLLCSPAEVHRLSRLIGADYKHAAGLSHGVMLDDNWEPLAGAIQGWLSTRIAPLAVASSEALTRR